MLLDYEIWKVSMMLFQKFPYNEDESIENVKEAECNKRPNKTMGEDAMNAGKRNETVEDDPVEDLLT